MTRFKVDEPETLPLTAEEFTRLLAHINEAMGRQDRNDREGEGQASRPDPAHEVEWT